MKLSVIIPAYCEPYLQQTIDSFLQTSGLGDQLEIIPVIDGKNWLKTPLKEDPRVKPLYLKRNGGMRAAINAGLSAASGEWIMKVDAHCLFAQDFDVKMLEHGAENRLLIPRRYSLDDKKWKRDDTRPYRDYHFLEFPHQDKYGEGLTVLDWWDKQGAPVDDTMIFQGSCWMAQRAYFMAHVGLLDDRDETYGSFVGEQHEIGLKYWLGGGEIKVNKLTWYAHLSKRTAHYATGKFNRLFKTAPETAKHHTWVKDHWMNDEEPNMKHDFAWLINKFSPPTWKLPYVK